MDEITLQSDGTTSRFLFGRSFSGAVKTEKGAAITDILQHFHTLLRNSTLMPGFRQPISSVRCI